jgi:cytochrome P450
VKLLGEHPELESMLRAGPRHIPAFVEETLRLESPFQGHFRVATRATTLRDVPIEAGDVLMLLWGAANRDPTAFDDPDRPKLDRHNWRAHLAFGHGIHLCVGAQLARRQAQLVLERLLESTSGLSLATQHPRYRPSAFVRTLDALPVRVLPRG